MTIYSGTVDNLGHAIKSGLDNIAAAIREHKSVTYNIIVTTSGDVEKDAQAANELLDRVAAREATVGHD